MESSKYSWKKIYSLILFINAGYILLLWVFMEYFG